MRFVWRTDVHLADRSPSSWKGDYPEEIWSGLQQVADIAREAKAVAVLDGGDFFHHKSPLKNSHGMVRRAIHLHRSEYPCPTYSVEGNHDITHNNLSSVGRQPLGVMFASGAFKQLSEEVFEGEGLRVRVVGVPYDPSRSLADLRQYVKKEGDTHLILVVHALAAQDPPAKVEEFWGEPVFRYSDLIQPHGADLFAFGHWHQDQGVVEIDGVQFVNIGSLSRGSLSKENLSRQPKVAVFDVTPTGIQVTSIPLKVRPAEEVFDLDRKKTVDREAESIESFVQKIVLESNFDPSQTIEQNIAKLDFAQEVRDEAMRFLEQFS